MIKYKHILFTYTPEQSVVVFNENEKPIRKPYLHKLNVGASEEHGRKFLLEYDSWVCNHILIKLIDEIVLKKLITHCLKIWKTNNPKKLNSNDFFAHGILVNCIDLVDGKAVFKEPVGEVHNINNPTNNEEVFRLFIRTHQLTYKWEDFIKQNPLSNPHLKPEQKEEGDKAIEFLNWIWLNKYTDNNDSKELYDIFLALPNPPQN